MNFDEALSYLLSLGHETVAMKLGLTTTELLLEALGNPQKAYPGVQIAGTNGKGSTAVILDSIYRAANIKSGLFTSPHLIRITERIRIAGQEISPANFARLATNVRAAAQCLLEKRAIGALPTFFEQITAIAFLAFAEAGVELAILETGLGGRLDSTTVARAETVAITPIDLDHQEYLGETIAEIAAEKAAIIRAGVQVFLAPQLSDAHEVILKRCQNTSVAPHFDDSFTTVLEIMGDGRLRVDLATNQTRYESVTLGLRGRHQIQNASLAVRLAESEQRFRIPKTAIIRGLEQASHAGRLELWPGRPSLLFDGAHNPAGARTLRDYLTEFVPAPVTLVFGAMRDKDLSEIANAVFPLASRIVLTEPHNARAATVAELSAVIPHTIDPHTVLVEVDPRVALQRAYALTPLDGVVCITGSLYLIGEIQSSVSATEDRPNSPNLPIGTTATNLPRYD
jgi:dihydrofolate synthase/folylpolyglutamate synthase